MLAINKAKMLYLNRVNSPSRISMLYLTGKLGRLTNFYTLTDDQLLELGFKIHNHVWLFPRWMHRILPPDTYVTENGESIHTDAIGVKILFDDFNLNYGIKDAQRILPTGTQTRPTETRSGSSVLIKQIGWLPRLVGWWRLTWTVKK